MRGRGVFAKERADERAQGDGSFVLPKSTRGRFFCVAKTRQSRSARFWVPRECQGDRVVDTLGQVSGLLVNKEEKRRHSKIVPALFRSNK